MSGSGHLLSRYPRALTLTPALLAQHRASQVLCLTHDFAGRHVGLHARRPVGYALHTRRGAVAGSMTAPPPPAEPPSLVALVPIRGVMEQRSDVWECGWTTGYDTIAESTLRALAALEVGAVVLDIDSPGGDGAGLEQMIARVRAAADAAGKPLIAYVNATAASAAYWIACHCDGVYMPPSGFVGSIGVLVAYVNKGRAMREEGYDCEILRDPPGKAVPNSIEPLDDLGRTRIQRGILSMSGRFMAAVSKRRGLTVDAVRALNGDLLDGQAAIDGRLADGLGSLEDTIALAASLAALREVS